MIDTRHLVKVAIAWTTIAYLICFGAVALFPDGRTAFAFYALYIQADLGSNAMTATTFTTGLAIWDFAGVLGAALFGFLYNTMK
jgi:hypothetical protein